MSASVFAAMPFALLLIVAALCFTENVTTLDAATDHPSTDQAPVGQTKEFSDALG